MCGSQPVSLPSRSVSLHRGAGDLVLNWTGGNGPFLIQAKLNLSSSSWSSVGVTSNRTFSLPMLGGSAFFRIQDGASGTITSLRATLTGAAERPTPVETTGTGSAWISIDGNTLTYLVAYQNLRAAASAAHVHGPADVNTATGVMFGLQAEGGFGTSGILRGSVTLTAEQKTTILSGMSYVNIHTGFAGGGEIRGQIVP